MKTVIQRVNSASVKIGGQIISKIEKGLVVLLGISESDTQKDIEIIVDKIKNLRVFEDSAGKMNISIKDIDGEVLLVSQFTLLADLQKGCRPSFTAAAKPPQAEIIYRQVMDAFREGGIRIKSGRFKEHMQVELINDGPATFIFDTNRKVT